MLADLVADFLHAIAFAAVMAADFEIVENDGPDARYVAIDPASGQVHSMFLGRGGTCRIPRSYRLLVEPVASVAMRPLCQVRKEWATQ